MQGQSCAAAPKKSSGRKTSNDNGYGGIAVDDSGGVRPDGRALEVLGPCISRQSALEQRHADRQGHGALRCDCDGRGRSDRRAARGTRRGSRSRSRLVRGMGRDGGSGRRRRRQGRGGRTPDHRRQQLHARGQLLLQRRALHPARAREAGDVSQGAARPTRRPWSACIPTSSASRCPTRTRACRPIS